MFDLTGKASFLQPGAKKNEAIIRAIIFFSFTQYGTLIYIVMVYLDIEYLRKKLDPLAEISF